MKKSKRYDEELNDIKNKIIDDIREYLSAAIAQEVMLTGAQIVTFVIDDQFYEFIERVSTNGVTICQGVGEEIGWNFEDCSTEQLLAILDKFENLQFEVYEEIGGEDESEED